MYGSISGLSILLHWSISLFLKPWYMALYQSAAHHAISLPFFQVVQLYNSV